MKQANSDVQNFKRNKHNLLTHLLFNNEQDNKAGLGNFKLDYFNEKGSSSKNVLLIPTAEEMTYSSRLMNKKDIFFNLKRVYNPNFIDEKDYIKYRIKSEDDYFKFIERNQRLGEKEKKYTMKDIRQLSNKLYMSFKDEDRKCKPEEQACNSKITLSKFNNDFNAIMSTRFDSIETTRSFPKPVKQPSKKLKAKIRENNEDSSIADSDPCRNELEREEEEEGEVDPFIDVNIDEQDDDEINCDSIKKLVKNIYDKNRFFDVPHQGKLSARETVNYLTSKNYLRNYFSKIKTHKKVNLSNLQLEFSKAQINQKNINLLKQSSLVNSKPSISSYRKNLKIASKVNNSNIIIDDQKREMESINDQNFVTHKVELPECRDDKLKIKSLNIKILNGINKMNIEYEKRLGESNQVTLNTDRFIRDNNPSNLILELPSIEKGESYKRNKEKFTNEFLVAAFTSNTRPSENSTSRAS